MQILTLDQILLFSMTAVVLAFTPGPDIIYVLTRGAAQGRKAGFAAAAGFSLGNLAHTFFAVVGLSALIVSSATAFTVIKLAGACYLAWLGYRIFRSDGMISSASGMKPKAGWAIFRQSVTANLLNPKVAVFFLALFPQFIEGNRGMVAAQTVALGLLFIFWTFVCFGLVAYGSGFLNRWLTERPAFGSRINKIAGTILIGLGVRLALSEA